MSEITDWPVVPIPEAPEPVARQHGLSGRLLWPADLDKIPEISPLIEDTIPLGAVGLLAGTHRTAKTFMALSMGLSVASGTDWYGRSVKRRKTLYISGEGHYGLNPRKKAWEVHHGVQVFDYFAVLEGIQLGQPDQVEILEDAIDAEGFGFVIIDTLARSSIGMDENSNSEMGRIIDALYRVQRATGDGTVLIVHHTGKDGTTVRGASALEAGVDVVYMTSIKDKGYLMDRKKNKDGPESDKRLFELVPVPGVNSVALNLKDGTDITGHAKTLMSVVSQQCRNGEPIPQSELRRLSGIKSSGSFTGALNRLITGNKLVKEDTSNGVILYLAGHEPF